MWLRRGKGPDPGEASRRRELAYNGYSPASAISIRASLCSGQENIPARLPKYREGDWWANLTRSVEEGMTAA